MIQIIKSQQTNKDCISNTRKRTDYVPGLTPTQRRAAEEYQKTQAQAGTSGRDMGGKGKPATKFRPKSAITDELTAKMGAAVQVKCTSTKHQRRAPRCDAELRCHHA